MNKLFELKNLLFRILKLNKVETYTVDEIEEYVNKLGKPKDLIERSYYQYRCQKKQHDNSAIYMILSFLMNFISFIIVVLLIIVPKFVFRFFVTNQANKYDAVCIFGRKLDDRIPSVLKEQFKKIEFAENKRILLTNKEKLFILKIWKRYPFSMNFILKNFLKVGIYRYFIDNSTYDVEAIISSCEYSYTSSVLTAYCREMNVEHINIMHGEIWVELSKTFFAFDKFYVWDEHYAKLCKEKMAAEPEQFCVDVPPCLKFSSNFDGNKKVDYKYYFQSHDAEQILHVKKIMDSLSSNYMVRPHPLYAGIKQVKKIFDAEKIESLDVSIEDSIMETKKVIAWDSTVLLQAYLNGEDTVIDDLTNIERYKYLCNAGYIMLGKSKKLSEISGIKAH